MASQKIRIKLSSYDVEMLDGAAAKIVETMQKSGEQFEIRTHKRLIDIYSPNVKLLDSIHLPAGVDIKIKL